MNPGVITDITDATRTADAPVADAAQDLSTAYRKAIAAHDTEAEPDAVAAVSAAAAELVKICGDSGLETAG
jgi:vacuolar-type H+-ATPase subunit H